MPLRAAARRFGSGRWARSGAGRDRRGDGRTTTWSDSTLQVKLGLVVLVAVLIGAHMRRPEWHALDAAIFVVSLAIVWLVRIVVAG